MHFSPELPAETVATSGTGWNEPVPTYVHRTVNRQYSAGPRVAGPGADFPRPRRRAAGVSSNRGPAAPGNLGRPTRSTHRIADAGEGPGPQYGSLRCGQCRSPRLAAGSQRTRMARRRAAAGPRMGTDASCPARRGPGRRRGRPYLAPRARRRRARAAPAGLSPRSSAPSRSRPPPWRRWRACRRP